MNHEHISFEKLHVFYMLCELQSFSLVGRTLGIHQSVVSRNIRELEVQLDEKLIADSHKPIMLTNKGKELYRLVQKMQNEFSHIEQNLPTMEVLRNLDKHYIHKLPFQNGDFKIFLSINISTGLLLVRNVKKIFAGCSEIAVDISFTNEINFSDLNTKDFFIINKPYDHIFVENNHIASYDMTFATSTSYIEKYGYPTTIDQLPYHPFLYIKDYEYIDIVSPELCVNLSKQYIVDNELCALKALQNDCGISLVPKFMLKHFDKLIGFQLEEIPLDFHIYIAISKIRKNNYTSLLVESFKKIIQDEMLLWYEENGTKNNPPKTKLKMYT